MKAVIYCRVSTEDQEREGTSLISQKEACLRKAQELGYSVTSSPRGRSVALGGVAVLRSTGFRPPACSPETGAILALVSGSPTGIDGGLVLSRSERRVGTLTRRRWGCAVECMVPDAA